MYNSLVGVSFPNDIGGGYQDKTLSMNEVVDLSEEDNVMDAMQLP